MIDHDVFNGDADGLCALQQLRLAEPREATLVTGAKRDIALLDRVRGSPGARITVLDISLARNRAALLRLLDEGARVQYVDHHEAGEIPDHPRLQARIDTGPTVCTSILVDAMLDGRWRRWAIAAAFGDGLPESARRLARRLPAAAAVDEAALQGLRRVGEAFNYNAYAADTQTAVVDAATLYRSLAGIADPLVLADSTPVRLLEEMSRDDLAVALGAGPALETAGLIAHVLPEGLPGRRARGLLAQRLQAVANGRAVAVVAPDGDGFATVSLRCAAQPGRSAAGFASRYPGGGGRATAAGIDRLPLADVDALLGALQAYFG